MQSKCVEDGSMLKVVMIDVKVVKWLIGVCFFGLHMLVFGQNTISNQSIPSTDFINILDLINQKDFHQASIELALFESVSSIHDEQSGYLRAKLSLAIDRDQQSIVDFLDRYPVSVFASDLSRDLADFYFEQLEYKKAIRWYEKCDQNDEVVNYRRGYAYYSLDKQDSARIYLSNVPAYGELSSKAQYYLGVILWTTDPVRAITYFDKAAEDENIAIKAAVYQAQYHFINKSYHKAIRYADDHIDQAIRLEKYSFYLIRGLSQYHLKNYQKAAQDLERAVALNPNEMPIEGLYALAISYLSNQQGELAVKPLRQIATQNHPLAQMASFQLGQWYVSRQNYFEANAAFQFARSGDDLHIQSEAHFLQAQCEMYEGHYDQVIELLEAYQQQYPNKNKTEVAEMLTSSYYHSSNYEKTLEFVESASSISPSMRKIYQEVAYRHGMLLFNDLKMNASIEYFNRSLRYPIIKSIADLTLLQLAEAFSYLQDYKASISYYNKVINSNSDQLVIQQALYGLAYANYNQGRYDQALPYFERLARYEGLEQSLELEINVRIADCNYVLKNYDQSINVYRRLLGSRWTAYSSLQLANAYDLKEDPAKAISFLESFYEVDTINPYSDDALLLLGQIKNELQDYAGAIRALDKLISSIPESPLLAETLIAKGLAASNLGDYPLAETSYHNLINAFPTSNLADDALLGLQALADKGFVLTDFDTYYTMVVKNQPDNNSLNTIAFERAKGYYFQQQYQDAINGLNKFLRENPLSGQKQPALYYLGDSYFRLGKWSESTAVFDQYLEGIPEEFYLRVLDRRGRSALEQNDTHKAQESFDLLLKNASNDREVYQANFGLIRVSVLSEDYEQVISLSDQLLSGNWKPVSAESDLAMIKSEAYLKLNNTQQATDELIKVMNGRENETNAKAHYQLAMIQKEEGSIAMSNETLLQLISNYGSYTQWKNLAYLQLIRNYLAQQNEFQARATIQSIIENSTDSLLINQAEKLLMEIESPHEIISDTTSTNGYE